MELNKKLILFQYLLLQFGYESFEQLREELSQKSGEASSSGYTFYAAAMMGRLNKTVAESAIQEYDEAIQGYEKRLREHRAEPYLRFKYYQWLSLLFTEYFLDSYYKDAEGLVRGLNNYLKKSSDFKEFTPYTALDLKKIAYWMATGSGKTLLMHCNYWQIMKYAQDWENIILITPNEGLSRQHYESLLESGIPAKLYTGNEESLRTQAGEVLILEITKLVRDKSGDGVSVDVDYFSEARNLVFIDEGHKGQKSEERTWKNLREHLTRGAGSFTFEYSATFGQIITKSTTHLLQEYGKAIVFDYSYRHFYTDGYGKDFSVFNLEEKNAYSETQKRLLLTGSLLGYYEQLRLFEEHETELRTYNIEKPLWVFVGSRVISSGGSLTQGDKQSISDVTQIVQFFEYALGQPAALQASINAILAEGSGLQDVEGRDIFEGKFETLKAQPPQVETVLMKVFNGIGKLEARQIKQAEGEIGLKTQTSDNYFAVINIGDVPKYGKTLEADTRGALQVGEDNFTKSLFQAIAANDSKINVLIGSKKFIEGWNSWRVSSMGLMNMGKSEGAQIIQLFGRGVRLKGKGLSLKRENKTAPYHIRTLQTLSIMGLNASYMNRFLEQIAQEVPEYTEYAIDVKFNHLEKWNGQLMTFRQREDKDFKKEELFALEYSATIAKRVTLDLRNKISVSAGGGFGSSVAEEVETYHGNILKQFSAFINWSELELEANRYKLMKGYRNLVIQPATIKELVTAGSYNLYCNKGQFGVAEALAGKIQRIALNLVKDYMSKYYADKEKVFLSRYLTYDMLDHQRHKEMFPASQQLIVKVPKKRVEEGFIKNLEESIKRIHLDNTSVLPSIHFDKHLYSPIASIGGNNRDKDIKTIPTRLTDSEKMFITDLKTFVISQNKERDKFKDKSLFVLRNLSIKGAGFYMESSAFYPDFIVWVIDGNKQYIYFLDPKGILLGDNHFNNSKILWCKNTAPELGAKIQEDLDKDQKGIQVTVAAYILSVTPFEEVRTRWGEGMGTTKKDFEQHHVLFMKPKDDYLQKIFEQI